MRCAVCQRSVRKTSLALIPKIEGGVRQGRCCAKCIASGVLIVPAREGAQCACGEPATVCGVCSEKSADKAKRGAADAKALAKVLNDRALAFQMRADIATKDPEQIATGRGIAAGLEMAANFLLKGEW